MMVPMNQFYSNETRHSDTYLHALQREELHPSLLLGHATHWKFGNGISSEWRKKNAIKIKKIRWSLRWKSHCCRWTRKGIVEIGHVQPKHSTGEPTTEMLIYTHA